MYKVLAHKTLEAVRCLTWLTSGELSRQRPVYANVTDGVCRGLFAYKKA